MTIKIVDTTASLKSIAAGLKLPVSMTSLAMVHLYGGTLAQSLQNWAPGQGAAVASGTVTTDAQSLTTNSSSGYLTSVMADSNDVTLIAVAAALNAPTNGGIIVGNGTSAYQTNLYYAPDDSAHVYPRGCRGGNTTLSTDPVSLNAYRCLSLRHSTSDDTGYIVDHTGNISQSFSLTYSTLGSAMLIGANYNSAFVGEIQHLLTIGFNRRLTSAEIATMYAWCQQYCAQLPTPVTV